MEALRFAAVLVIAVVVLLGSGRARRRLAGSTWPVRLLVLGGTAVLIGVVLALLSLRRDERTLQRPPATFTNPCAVLGCTGGPLLGDYTGDVVVRDDRLDVVDRFVLDSDAAQFLDAPPDGWQASTQRGRYVLTHRRSIPVDVPKAGRHGVALEVPVLSVGDTDIEAEAGRFRITAPANAVVQTAPAGEQQGFGEGARTVVALGRPDDPLEPPRIDLELRGAWARSPVLRWIGAVNWGEWARWVVTTVFAGVLAPVGESLRRLLRRGRKRADPEPVAAASAAGGGPA